MKRLSWSITALMALVTVGCNPQLKVNVLQPAPVNLGSAKRLSIVQSEGRRSAKEFVIGDFLAQARAAGYFTARDRSEEGITVKVAGRTVAATGGAGAAQDKDEIGLRLDVLEWTANSETKKIDVKDSKGKVTSTREVKVYTGKVLLAATAFNVDGKAMLAEKEYEMKAEADDEEDAIRAAARMAVGQLLHEITPRYVQRYIRMDNDDKAQEPIVKVAESGNMTKAVEEMRAYLATNPGSAPAQYNLAALLDATGSYEEALDLYTKAITTSSKDYYIQMKAECAKRLADQQALNQ
jgi:tetratricopeptide (TPR) repeat protein